jgi:ABC-type transport system substrate-binding protein
MRRLPPAASRLAAILCLLALSACGGQALNNPYPPEQDGQNILYSAFAERPKHLDPARAYSSNEYEIIAQVYEPLYQYHYLKRPYTLAPLTAESPLEPRYLDAQGQTLPADAPEAAIAISEYTIGLKPGIRYQPHPAFAKTPDGRYRYHALTAEELSHIQTLADFPETASRDLTAEDYVYQIKRLMHPQLHSPIAELMKEYIVGLKELGDQLEADFRARKDPQGFFDIRGYAIAGVQALDSRHLQIRLHGKYPQFRFWLAMPFFAPMPWEAEVFFAQPGLAAKNISLDWYPIGTGAYMLTENNPNRRMVLARNPNYHEELYPSEGAPGDAEAGLLQDQGKRLPFIDQVVYTLEKETIPYWNKFLQGYYDASGLASDNFDQAVTFAGQGGPELTANMKEKGIGLLTAVNASTYYMGFNMLDPVVGGYEERASKLRRAIAIAVDYEEFVSIFANGRGVPAQGVIAPGIYGYEAGQAGMNPYIYDWKDGQPQRKPIAEAQGLLAEAGYPGGVDAKTGTPLVLYYDVTASGPDSKSILNWYRKQFSKLGIQLVLRATDYNQFQQKISAGNAQIFSWGWNADYPDPENFLFLLHGPNAKVGLGGENAANYKNPEYDALFERMRHMDDGPERLAIIRKMQEILRHDSPWLFGYHPKTFSLHHDWFLNLKPNLMANNELKYQRLDIARREHKRKAWNQPIYWPLPLGFILLALAALPAWLGYRRGRNAKAF